MPEWLSEPKRMLIGGKFHEGRGPELKSINPANGETLASFTEATTADVTLAVEAAETAFRGPWRAMKRRDRSDRLRRIGDIIRRHATELATIESRNNGKTLKEALYDDLPEAADVFDYYAGWIDKIYAESCPVEEGFVNFTRREPLGVCALIVPWNFPLLLAAWKIAPALAMGNTVVVKPSPFTSLSMLRLAEILHAEEVLPPGVLNVVVGGTEAGEALSSHPRVAKISFTGSTDIGKRVAQSAAGSNLKTVSLELGGKSPNIVFDDAPDIEGTIKRSFTAMFSHKGEKCSEPTRLLLQRGIYDRFAEALAPMAEAVKCGDPFDPSTDQGPQCHELHMQKILGYIELGKKEGAKLLAGGGRDTRGGNEKGYFVRPTIFGNVSNGMTIARDEIFGPVLVLMPFTDEDEAVAIANDTTYGLAAGVYTSDVSRAHRVAQRLEAGMVFVNHYGCYDFASPFGGFKQSGWGKEMAIHSLEAYTRLKSVWIKI